MYLHEGYKERRRAEVGHVLLVLAAKLLQAHQWSPLQDEGPGVGQQANELDHVLVVQHAQLVQFVPHVGVRLDSFHLCIEVQLRASESLDGYITVCLFFTLFKRKRVGRSELRHGNGCHP